MVPREVAALCLDAHRVLGRGWAGPPWAAQAKGRQRAWWGGKDHRVLLCFDIITLHFKNKETGLENLGKTS